MVKNFSEILPQEIGAIRAFEETIAAGGDPSLLGIVWAGLVTAELIKQLPNNGKHPQQGRIGSKRKNRPTPTERADKIAE